MSAFIQHTMMGQGPIDLTKVEPNQMAYYGANFALDEGNTKMKDDGNHYKKHAEAGIVPVGRYGNHAGVAANTLLVEANEKIEGESADKPVGNIILCIYTLKDGGDAATEADYVLLQENVISAALINESLGSFGGIRIQLPTYIGEGIQLGISLGPNKPAKGKISVGLLPVAW